MAALIESLIDKSDNVELVRDQIASILVIESERQQQLATTAGKDSRLWKLRVFSERSNPWHEFIDPPDDALPDAGFPYPIVNVCWDQHDFDRSTSTVVGRQRAEAVFNIDCYGSGISVAQTPGHDPGDARAALEAQRAVRLCRNILMSAAYVDLAMLGVVWDREIESIKAFQPQIDGKHAQHVQAARIAFKVRFNEFSPQFEGQPLELISLQVFRSETGQLLLRADYPQV